MQARLLLSQLSFSLLKKPTICGFAGVLVAAIGVPTEAEDVNEKDTGGLSFTTRR